MTSITLAQAALLSQDELLSGVITNIWTVNQWYELMPFMGIHGNSLAYDRELVLGDVQLAAVGDTITAKNPATFTQVNSKLTTIIGDAEVNGLVQATQSDHNNQEAIQIASKAKSMGRQYQGLMITGTGASNQFPGLITLTDSSKLSTTATNGETLSFSRMDEVIDNVIDKDGQVDYMVMHSRTVRSYKAILRALGGNSVDDMYQLPSGARVNAYSGVPIFRNDWIPVNQTQGTGTGLTSFLAGTFDDGSGKHGVSGLTAENAAGVQVEEVGVHQSRDETITRVKWYVSMALFSLNGLAQAPGISN